MKYTLITLLIVSTFSCDNQINQSKIDSSAKYNELEAIEDCNKNLVMTKSGVADSNNFRTFKYYDTTRRLVMVIKWGGLDSIRRMISPQTSYTGINKILAGKYFYDEYLLNLFGPPNNFQRILEEGIINNHKAFNVTDSIIFNTYKFHIIQTEFDNLKNYLN